MNWFRDALNRIIAFLPALIAGVIILLIGYVVARLLRAATARVLMSVGFDRRLVRLRLLAADEHPAGGSRGVAAAVFWVVILATLIQVAHALGLEAIAAGLSSVMAFLPHVLAAVLIMAGAIVLGNWIQSRIAVSEGAQRASVRPNIVASAVRAGVIALGAFMALRELQIAESIVTIAFTLSLGAIALASALAFGLGSRRTAEQLTSDWYERRRANGPVAVPSPPESRAQSVRP